MTHLIFQEADMPVLQKAINLDESLWGEILLIKDDYAVGPLKNIFTEEGMEARKQWWQSVLAGGGIDGKVDDGSVGDDQTVKKLIKKLYAYPDENVWIWAAQNKHDVSGYYWLMSQLKDFQGRIYILYLNNLPFFNDKGNIFYPDRLATIPPKEFLKAKKLARLITLSEFEVDPDEWRKLAEQEKHVRLLEGGKKLVQYDENFFDEELQKYITGDWQKAGRIIHQFFNKAKHTAGDTYLLWRLKQIVDQPEYEVQGELKGMKDFEVKRKTK